MKVEALFSTVLLQKHPTQYFQCLNCGYVQTEEPYWMEEAYKASINDSDTGMMMRSFWHRNIAATLIYFLFNQKGQFLDYGGGYGVFVRLMRDVGYDFYWQDKHTENLFAKGFEFPVSEKLTIELLTCFEAFEHFVEPVTELENLLSISQNILLSTEFIPEPTPPLANGGTTESNTASISAFSGKKLLSILPKNTICISIQMAKIFIY